jgi:hypothetical protein
MAGRLLSESERAALMDALEKVELEKLGAGTHGRLHGLMDKLHNEIFPKG